MSKWGISQEDYPETDNFCLVGMYLISSSSMASISGYNKLFEELDSKVPHIAWKQLQYTVKKS